MPARDKENQRTIGLFNDSYPPIMDGVSLTVQNYAKWLSKKDVPVCVIAPRFPNFIDHEPFPVYRYTSIPLLGRKPYRFGLPKTDMDLRNELKNISFGLVHAHCPFSSGSIALKLAKQNQIPLVATFHSKYRDDFEHSVRNKCIAKLMTNQVIKFFEKADEVWIPQASVEETIREYGFKGKVEIVDNGNDFASNNPIEPIKKEAKKQLNIDNDTFVFLFVGQHIWEKNTRLIVESLEKIKDLNFNMIFIGTGYAKNELEKLVNDYGLSSKVQFKGVINDRNQLKQYYAVADLFLFPSIYDNAPLVIREAAAMQTPSVLLRDTSSAENVIDYFNGFLTENSVESFSSKLRELLSAPDKIKIAGENAANSLARSWESVAEEVHDRYQKLMARKWNK